MLPVIFDCFLFDGEYDLLLLRLRLHAPYVSAFIIVQSSLTFQGNHSAVIRLDVTKLEKKVPQIIGKIKFSYLEPAVFDCCSSAVDREILCRQYFAKHLNCLNEEDIVIVSDVDEILDFKAIDLSKLRPDTLYRLCLLFCYFTPSYVCQNMPWWKAPIAFSGYLYRKHRLVMGTLRPVANHNSSLPLPIRTKCIYYCGIHMSFLGGYGEVVRKLSRYTDRPVLTAHNAKDFAYLIENGIDVFGRSLIWRIDTSIRRLFTEDFYVEMSRLPALGAAQCLPILPGFSVYLNVLASIDNKFISSIVSKAYCGLLFASEFVSHLLARPRHILVTSRCNYGRIYDHD